MSTLGTSAQDIFRTACSGNLASLDSLLASNSINIKDDRGRSLLHWSIICNQDMVFNYLVENGINPNLEDLEGKTPMHIAIHFERLALLDTLVGLQKSRTWVDKYANSLLETAILKRNPAAVKRIIDQGVELNTPNSRGSTPVEIARRIEAKEIYTALISSGADTTKIRVISCNGEYMGQQCQKFEPSLFAPNFISTEESEFGSIFNADGTEFYYGVDVNGKNEIRCSRMKDNRWSKPKTILTHKLYSYNDPFLSNDEKKLYFISDRALDGIGEPKDIDIWYVQKEDDGWSEPHNAGFNINSANNEYYISFTNEGTMYFSSNVKASDGRMRRDYDIYYSKQIGGHFQKPVALSRSVNSDEYEADVFISPDEDYMIFCSTRVGGFGQGDLYISFKNNDETWKPAINMGKKINSVQYEYCPFVTKDGRYLFFTRNQDIYWVGTDLIDQIKKKAYLR